MLPKRFRLTKTGDFARVHREGCSWAGRLVVLVRAESDLAETRIGLSVGRRVGGAVVRNRVKRWMREALRPHLQELSPGWDVVLIARRPIAGAGFEAVRCAVGNALETASLVSGQGNTGSLDNT